MRSHFYLLDMMALRLSPPLFFGLPLQQAIIISDTQPFFATQPSFATAR